MDNIKEELESRARNGKISCIEALEIAEKYGQIPAVIGKELDKLKIKIKGCQLGCFK